MKEYRLRQIEAKELVRITCDRCGRSIPLPEPDEIRDLRLEFTRGKRSLTADAPEVVESWQVEDLCDYCVGLLKRLLQRNKFTVTEVVK